MTQKSATKDELFLIKLYEMALDLGFENEKVDRYEVARHIGQNSKGVDTIVKHLAQANFIKKEEGSYLRLTPHGLRLVKKLLNERGIKTKKIP